MWHSQPWDIEQCGQERNLELGKGPQDELQLADVAVHAQLDRGGARDAKVHGDVAVPARRRRAVGRVQAVLYPHHVDVMVGGKGLKAGGEVVGAVEDDALPAQVDKPRDILQKTEEQRRRGVGGGSESASLA